MNISEFLRELADYPVSETEDIYMEFPSLCGRSDAGKMSNKYPACKQHGHLSLSVDKKTFYQVEGRTVALILLTVPKSTLTAILDKKNTESSSAFGANK